jgi:hypothetical protein
MNAINVTFQVISAVFAFLAAVLWFRASSKKRVEHILQDIERLGGPDFFGSHFVEIARGLVNQSKLNASAAVCAGVAAAFQAAAITIGIFIRS